MVRDEIAPTAISLCDTTPSSVDGGADVDRASTRPLKGEQGKSTMFEKIAAAFGAMDRANSMAEFSEVLPTTDRRGLLFNVGAFAVFHFDLETTRGDRTSTRNAITKALAEFKHIRLTGSVHVLFEGKKELRLFWTTLKQETDGLMMLGDNVYVHAPDPAGLGTLFYGAASDFSSLPPTTPAPAN